MKKIFYTLSAALLMTTACNKATINISEATGTVSFSVSKEANSEYIVTKAGLDDVDVNTFTVNIKSADGGSYDRTWSAYSEMEGILELPSGTYTVTASSPNVQAVAWEQPVFGGTQNFVVKVGAVSNVNLECSIQNMKVTISPTALFTSELKDYSVKVSSEDGSLTWTKDDIDAGKAGYFAVAPLTVEVNGTRWNNDQAPTETLNITSVAAKDHHIINLSANVTGQAGLTLTVSNEVNDRVQDVTVDGFEEIPVASGDETQAE